MSDLKPCPFCGGEARLVKRDGASLVYCTKCERGTGLCRGDAAVTMWNTRPAEDAKDREIDNLKRTLLQIVEIANRRGHLTVATLQKDAWYGLAKIAEEALADAPDTGTMEE